MEHPKTGTIMKEPSGKDLGDYRKRGNGPSTLGFVIACVLILSTRSLLISWWPACSTWLKPETMPKVGVSLRWKGQFPRVIRPKKECIKSCETCFAKNALKLNDKGPSTKWICFPKFYGLLAIWPWLGTSPHSSLDVIYCLILTAWQWLIIFTYTPCILMQITSNKSPLRNRLKAGLLWRDWPPFLPKQIMSW